MPRTEFHSQLATLRDEVLALGRLTVTAVERAIGALQEDDRTAAASIVAGDAAIDARHTRRSSGSRSRRWPPAAARQRSARDHARWRSPGTPWSGLDYASRDGQR